MRILLACLLVAGWSAGAQAGEGCDYSKAKAKAEGKKDCSWKGGADCEKLKGAKGIHAALPKCPDGQCWAEVSRALREEILSKGLTVEKALAQVREKFPQIVSVGLQPSSEDAQIAPAGHKAFDRGEWKSLGQWEGLEALVCKYDKTTVTLILPGSQEGSIFWVALREKSTEEQA